eukprot:gene6940-7600_t
MDQQNMLAIVQYQPGGPESLSVGHVQKPSPGDGEVLIKVMATALNRADTLQRKGKYSPPPGSSPILGLEAAGIIEAVGTCVTKFKEGDAVIALLTENLHLYRSLTTLGGGYAEYCTAPQGQVLPFPRGLSFVQGAGIAETWLTAYQLLHFVGSVKPNDNVLIHAGSSGVGIAAVQLVRFAGAFAYVTVGSEEKRKKALEYGANGGVVRQDNEWKDAALALTEGKEFNMILDCVGGTYWEQNADVVAVDGQWVLYGLMGGPDVNGPILAKLLRKRVALLATTLRARSLEYKAKLVSAFATSRLPLFETNQLRVIIDKVFPLRLVSEAHAMMDANKNTGKIILKVTDDADRVPVPRQREDL